MSEPKIPHLELIHQGKVRDIYALDDEYMLIVTTDRVSAFDVILPTTIPGKGAVLTAVANFWFQRFSPIIANHLSGIDLREVIADKELYRQLAANTIIVKRMNSLPVEAIMRGFIIGSGWKDYQNNDMICGIKLPTGLQLAAKLPDAIYTPSTKAEVGAHDENVNYEYTVKLLGKDMADEIRQVSYRLYTKAYEYALKKGIIIADTKFEFGTDKAGNLVLIDEVLTPDSSRFWDKDKYVAGVSPPSFDKQFVRDYLDTLDWDKKPPGPELPAEVVKNTADRYEEAKIRLLS